MTALGGERFNLVLQPVEGKALPVYAGETLRITQVGHGQCVDFNCFNLHDYKERFCAGFTRKTHGFRPVPGDVLWSNPPRFSPMLAMVHMPATCVTDTLHGRCNALIFENYFGFDLHTNCQDTFAEAIGEYGLTPDDVHDSFNFWMDTGWDDEGVTCIRRNTGRRGDHVDLLALMDVLAVPIVCGSGDVQLSANFLPKPIQLQVFERSPESDALADRYRRHYSFRSQRHLEEFRVQTIRTERALRPVPGYTPHFVNHPLTWRAVEVALTDGDLEALERIRFAEDQPDEETLREAVMRWYARNRSRRGRLKERPAT